MKQLASVLTRFGALTAHPAAFVIVLIYTAAWVAFDPKTLNWHGAATLATWMMTLVIQRSEHRDTQAIHAKLDDLLKSVEGANPELSKIDEEEPEEVERHRRAQTAQKPTSGH